MSEQPAKKCPWCEGSGLMKAGRKPTTTELEVILDQEEDVPIEILPNGEVRAAGKPTKKRPITLRENLGGEYAKVA